MMCQSCHENSASLHQLQGLSSTLFYNSTFMFLFIPYNDNQSHRKGNLGLTEKHNKKKIKWKRIISNPICNINL